MLHVIEVGERAYPVTEAGIGRHILHPFALYIERRWLVPQSCYVFSPCPGGHRLFSSISGASLARLCRRRERSDLHPATGTVCCRNAGITSWAKRLSCP